jgi:hypothetical protein
MGGEEEMMVWKRWRRSQRTQQHVYLVYLVGDIISFMAWVASNARYFGEKSRDNIRLR